MSTTETVKTLKEYASIPIVDLIESSTNPRNAFDLVGCVEGTSESKDEDPLATAAALYKIDAKALRANVAKEEREKAQKKAEKTVGKPKSETASKLEKRPQVA
jgi:hypothetical protein